MHQNQTNYIRAVTEIHRCYPQNQENIHKLFGFIIDNKQYLPESLGESFNQVKYTFYSLCPRREITSPKYREIVDEYLALAKTTLNHENNALFLRYLSIYATGHISHKIFVRLILPLINVPNPFESKLIQDLPSFMAALNSGVFFDFRKKFSSPIEEFATELIISATSTSPNSENSKSLSKCLSLLASGTIRAPTAKKWLSKFCRPDLIRKIDLIDDFSSFHPSHFPDDLIMTSSFETNKEPKNVFELFQDNMMRRYDPHSLRPVVVDILELKMRQLRHLILSLAIGEKVTAQSLAFVYGSSMAQHILKMPNRTIPMVMRLGKLFEDAHDKILAILNRKMEDFEPDNFEYRILYKKMMNHNIFAFFYELPGSRTIHFGTRHAAYVALSALQYFINNVLFKKPEETKENHEEEQKEQTETTESKEAAETTETTESNEKDNVKLLDPDHQRVLESLNAILPLFQESGLGHHYVVNEKPIHSIVYLAEVAKRIQMQGNIEEVVVTDQYTFAPINEQGPYGTELIRMIDGMTNENSMKGYMSVCDIPLVRVARSLSGFETNVLPEFPENIEQVNIYMTMTQIEEPDFSILCVSAFSPCYVEPVYIDDKK